MIAYQDIKTWFGENKQKFVILICFVLVFVIGFGVGSYKKESDAQRQRINSQDNYTTKQQFQATGETAGEGNVKSPEVVTKDTAQVLGAKTDKTCAVKGNASSKIYHVPGGAFYETLRSPRCFATEAEAKAAGYRKSSR